MARYKDPLAGDWKHVNDIRAIHGHAPRDLCPECGCPVHIEEGDEYAPRVRCCANCSWNDYDDQLEALTARSDESALYGDAHTADT